MGLTEEFADLIEDTPTENLEEVSKVLLKQYDAFLESKITTFSGVNKQSIIKCITKEKTDTIPWEHITFKVDVGTLRDISKPRLTEFSIPNFVEELQCIGDEHHSGFGFNEYGRNHLRQIDIPNCVYVIGNEVFKMFSKLSSVTFSEGSRLTVIGDEAFAYCESLAEINMLNCERLTIVGKDIFRETRVKTLKISSRLRKFDKDTFRGCSINTVYIDERKLLFNDFINMLKDNDYDAFWM